MSNMAREAAFDQGIGITYREPGGGPKVRTTGILYTERKWKADPTPLLGPERGPPRASASKIAKAGSARPRPRPPPARTGDAAGGGAAIRARGKQQQQPRAPTAGPPAGRGGGRGNRGRGRGGRTGRVASAPSADPFGGQRGSSSTTPGDARTVPSSAEAGDMPLDGASSPIDRALGGSMVRRSKRSMVRERRPPPLLLTASSDDEEVREMASMFLETAMSPVRAPPRPANHAAGASPGGRDIGGGDGGGGGSDLGAGSSDTSEAVGAIATSPPRQNAGCDDARSVMRARALHLRQAIEDRLEKERALQAEMDGDSDEEDDDEFNDDDDNDNDSDNDNDNDNDDDADREGEGEFDSHDDLGHHDDLHRSTGSDSAQRRLDFSGAGDHQPGLTPVLDDGCGTEYAPDFESLHGDGSDNSDGCCSASSGEDGAFGDFDRSALLETSLAIVTALEDAIDAGDEEAVGQSMQDAMLAADLLALPPPVDSDDDDSADESDRQSEDEGDGRDDDAGGAVVESPGCGDNANAAIAQSLGVPPPQEGKYFFRPGAVPERGHGDTPIKMPAPARPRSEQRYFLKVAGAP
jgi:hypothetical protein